MVTNNAIDIATGDSLSVLQGQGVGVAPLFTDTPSITSVTLSGGTSLNTYVQGTFTPVLQFGGASVGITYTTQSGQYTQIGDVLFFNLLITLSSNGTSTGNATITGFPVNTGGTQFRGLVVFSNNFTFTTNYILLTYSTVTGSPTVTLVQYEPGAVTVIAKDTNFAANTSIRFSGFYFTT